MPPQELVLFSFLALTAEILGTIGGFGSSLLFVPLASYFLDFHTVLGITALFHVMSNLSKIAFFRKGVDKMTILYIGIPSVVFVIIGAYLTKFIDTRILQIFLAIFLIALSLLFLIFKQLKLKPTASNSVGGGVLSGLAAGLLGTGGAIRGIVLASYNLKMDTFIATSAIIDLAIDFSRSVVYTFNGYVHTHDLYLIPILLVVSVLGTFIGKQILKKMSEEQFKSIVLVLVLFTGVMSLVKVYME
jgi:uncharacterized membrane protein YfcA